MLARNARLLATLIAAALTTGGLTGCTPPGAEEEQDTLPTDPVPVQAVQVELTTLRPSVDLIGTLVVKPENSTVVSPQIAGWIQKVSVVEGVKVRQGDEVVLFDSRLAEVDVDKAEAAVAEKEAILARLKRGRLPQEIEMAQQELRKSEEQTDAVRQEIAAIEPLWQKKEISELQYQKVESSLRAAEAAQAFARANLELLQAGTPQEEILEAEARLALAKSELEAARLNSDLCRIASPISGTVTQVFARQGAFVERSAPLLNIDDLSSLFMQVRIPSIYMAKVQAGARVDVGLTTFPGQVLSGTVSRISGEADTATGDMDAFVELPNGDDLLRPGLACRGRLLLPEMPDVLAIPVAAVADHAGTPVVTVVRNGKAHEVEVTLGTRTQDLVQVTAGLEEGDVVVTEGGYGLPDGCPVRVAPESAETSPTADPAAATPEIAGPMFR